jgi:hypothetical protein
LDIVATVHEELERTLGMIGDVGIIEAHKDLPAMTEETRNLSELIRTEDGTEGMRVDEVNTYSDPAKATSPSSRREKFRLE